MFHQKTNHKKNFLFKFAIKNRLKLLDFLLVKIKLPKCKIKSILKHQQVLINGVPVTQFDYLLNKDDELIIVKKSSKEINLIKQPKLPFDILYEDNDFIVVNKPSSLLSVPSDKDKNSVYYLLSRYIAIQNKKKRLYIVHRLDKEASGILVFAKNFLIKDLLQKKWNTLVEKRHYYVVVEGKMEKKSDLLVDFLKKIN